MPQWFIYDARTNEEWSEVCETEDAAKEQAMSEYVRRYGLQGERVDITVDVDNGYWQAGRQNEDWDPEKQEYRKDFFKWRFISYPGSISESAQEQE